MRKQLNLQLWGRRPNVVLVGVIALYAYFYYVLGAVSAGFAVRVGGRFLARHPLLLPFFDLPAHLLYPGWILGFVLSVRFVKVCRSKPFTETFLVLPEMQPKLFRALIGQIVKIAILTEIVMRLVGWIYIFPHFGSGVANFALFRRANYIESGWSLRVVFGECAAFLCAVGLNGLYLFCASYVVFRLSRRGRWFCWALGLPVAVTLVQIALGLTTLSYILERIAGTGFLLNENAYYASAVLILVGVNVVLAKITKRGWRAMMDQWREEPAH